MSDWNGHTPVTRRTRRRHGVLKGQAYVFFALALPVLCGMLALAVDVGTTTARHQALQHAADNAALAGAYALYGWHNGAATTTLTDNAVWTAIASKLTTDSLTVKSGGYTGVPVPSDPCTPGSGQAPYLPNQVAVIATYLDADGHAIIVTGTTPYTVGNGIIPFGAYGVEVTLGGCQPAGFGGVIGHARYTIWVNASAGQAAAGPTPTPGPLTATGAPYAISAAPYGDCAGAGITTANMTTTLAWGDPEQFYCKNVYQIGSPVTLYCNGNAGNTPQCNDYGHDSNFKGFIGSPYYIGQEDWISTGGGSNGPTSCPAQVTVPIITGVDHTSGGTDYFAILETVTVAITSCGNPTQGTILSVCCDPYGLGIVGAGPTATPTDTPVGMPSATPTATTMPSATPTATTMPSPMPTTTPVAPTKHGSKTGTSSGTSLSIQQPVGAQANDVLIAQITVQNNDPTSITPTVPGVWHLIRKEYGNVSATSAGVSQALYYHVVGITDTGPYTWSVPAAAAAGNIVDYYNVDTGNPIITDNGSASSLTRSILTTPQLTTSVSNTVLLGFFGLQGGTTSITVPAGETQECPTPTTGTVTSACADEAITTTAATGPLSATAGTPNYYIGQLVALQPAPPATPTPGTPTVTPTSTPPPPTSTPTTAPTSTPGGPTSTPTPPATCTPAPTVPMIPPTNLFG